MGVGVVGGSGGEGVENAVHRHLGSWNVKKEGEKKEGGEEKGGKKLNTRPPAPSPSPHLSPRRGEERRGEERRGEGEERRGEERRGEERRGEERRGEERRGEERRGEERRGEERRGEERRVGERVVLRRSKGDLIGADLTGQDQVIKTNADVKALTYCDLQHISVRALREVLGLYPEYGSRFSSDIHHNLTYNLREGSEAEGLTRFSRSPRLSQERADKDHKLPFIVEAEDVESGEDMGRCPTGASHQERLLLMHGLSSPVCHPGLSSLLGEELRHVSALRLCRYPAQGCRGSSPSPQLPSSKEVTPTPVPTMVTYHSSCHRPAKLLIPSLHCVSPLNLSPRVVDGIEDNGQSFHFNVEQGEAKTNSKDGPQPNPNPSSNMTAANDWQTQVPFSMPAGPHPSHLQHDPLSHPARNVWAYSGVPPQGRGLAMGQKVEIEHLHQTSNPRSSCLHPCCSDRGRTTGQGLEAQYRPFQTSRTTPNSPYMGHSQGRTGPSLLDLSSAFPVLPGAGPGQVKYKASIPIISTFRPLCSPGSLSQSHPSLSVQVNSDRSHSPSSSPTPIHVSLTPTGQPQLHTTFSSHSGVYTSVSPTYNQTHNQTTEGQGSLNRARQNDLVGSSPVHTLNSSLPLVGQSAGPGPWPDFGGPKTEYPQGRERPERMQSDAEQAVSQTQGIDISTQQALEVEPLWGLEVTR
ncbi:unnamed protein product [Coregonus sp. 'balchen']|nr:unnamed protein product [Coregonus sp. 'balchen']